jgi:hypothetical protein
MRRTLPRILLVLFLASALSLPAQSPPKDISAIYAEGKTIGNVYKNDYFGLTLSIESGHFTEGGFISAQGKRARLIDAQANAANWQDKYEIAVLADLLSANPLIRSAQQYVGILRKQFEREGLATVQDEIQVKVSGVLFVEAILKVKDEGNSHYRAIYSTFLNGYILSLDVSAASPEQITQLVSKTVKLTSQASK